MGLPGAARRVFLDDATEVYTAEEIPRDSEVYISCGENFKDPFKGAKSKERKILDISLIEINVICIVIFILSDMGIKNFYLVIFLVMYIVFMMWL